MSMLIRYSCGHKEVELGSQPYRHGEPQDVLPVVYLCPQCARWARKLPGAEGLPTLFGTPKMVTWATAMRAEGLPRIREYADQLAEPLRAVGLATEAATILDQVVAELEAIDDSAWWIDFDPDEADDIFERQLASDPERFQRLGALEALARKRGAGGHRTPG